jgi:hypothetical protein
VGFAEESATLGVEVSIVGWGVERSLGPVTVEVPFGLLVGAGGCFLSS